MAASPRADTMVAPPPQDKWSANENGGPPVDIDRREPPGPPPGTDSSARVDPNDRYRSEPPPPGQDQVVSREKQIKVCILQFYHVFVSQQILLRTRTRFLFDNCCVAPHVTDSGSFSFNSPTKYTLAICRNRLVEKICRTALAKSGLSSTLS